jgi:phenylalanyl-tRNA synthetase beta chain
MKINYQWLKEFVDVELSPRMLASQLTMVGLAVDSVEEHGGESVLDFDLTSNRPDCLSHLGIAREVAVISGKQLSERPALLQESGPRTDEVTSVQIDDLSLCSRYTARVVRGVKIGPSPQWLVSRLESVGQRSINNVADITNLVLLELGQPLHAFDLQRLAGHRVVVRQAIEGEKLTTLDGAERELSRGMLVIADAERVVALAGIMGGADTEITDATTDVLLESAAFNAASVRQTAKALGMSTEASYRFERGTDVEGAVAASDRAAALIAELAGGEVLGGVIDVRAPRGQAAAIPLRLERYTALTGLEISIDGAKHILEGLGLEVTLDREHEGLLRAVPPTWRIDLAIEEDLIEEVARISGYDHVRAVLPGGAGTGTYLRNDSARRTMRRTLTGFGFNEAMSFSFVSGDVDRLLSRVPENARLKLQNPIDETQSHMRTTVLVGLLEATSRNINRGNRTLRLFELGKCFEDVEKERPREGERLGIVMTGLRNEHIWQGSEERMDFFDLKGVLETLSDNLGKKQLEISPIRAIGYLHPGRAAVISLDGKEIGCLGQLHPRVASHYKFKQAVYLAEVDFTTLLASESVDVRYRPLPRFPVVVRDLSILIDADVAFAEVERAIHKLEIPELTSIRLFDLYTGSELPAGKRSLALSLRFVRDDRTMTDQEINAAHARIVSTLAEGFDADIR